MAAAQPALRALSNLLRNAVMIATFAQPRPRGGGHRVPAGLPQLPPITGAMGSLCAACWAQVRFIEVPFASVWARASPWISAVKGFYRPRRSPILWLLISRMGRWRKYSDRMELTKPLGAWMARAGDELLVEADLLVPVPLHRRRLPSADSTRPIPWRKRSPPNAASWLILSPSRG